MDACPICRAKLNGSTTCRRCRADLAKVREVEQRAQVLAVAAVMALVAGDRDEAADWIDRAHAVHASPEVRRLRALILRAGSLSAPWGGEGQGEVGNPSAAGGSAPEA